MTMATDYDFIVIGAGHNGLTTAAYLAQAGQRGLVLERRPGVGGTLVTESPWPGYRVDTAAHTGRLAAEVVRELGLGRHGLRAAAGAAGVVSLLPDGRPLPLSNDARQTQAALRPLSPSDAARWPDFLARFGRFAALLREAYHLTMPRLPEIPAGELPPLARFLLRWRGLGKREMMELLRILPMSAQELFDEWFETPALKGVLGARSVHALTQGPFSAGTAFLFLHHWINHGGPFPVSAAGGVGQFTQALAGAARAAGAEIRTGAAVTGINVVDSRAVGVTLADGADLSARRVISAVDPKRTFLELLEPLILGPEFAQAVRTIKMRGAWAKVNLALAGRPAFTGLEPAAPPGPLILSPSLPYLEQAYDAAKYGGLSRQPYLEVAWPTLADPSLAPEGRHILSVHVQYAPYHLRAGAWDTERETLGDLVVQTLAEYAPDLPGIIEQRQVLTPLDLERTFGLTEGSLYHGEMMLDQILFMRPVPGWAQYRTPLAGLYLCGPGTHPGGGVSGLAGRNAAREILKDAQLKG